MIYRSKNLAEDLAITGTEIELIPLFDRTVVRFVEDLKQHPENYKMVDIKREFNHSPHENRERYSLVVDGRLVSLDIPQRNVSVSGISYVWLRDSVSLEGAKAELLIGGIRPFVKKQNLTDLMEEARARLKEEKVHLLHLPKEMFRFYFAETRVEELY